MLMPDAKYSNQDQILPFPVGVDKYGWMSLRNARITAGLHSEQETLFLRMFP